MKDKFTHGLGKVNCSTKPCTLTTSRCRPGYDQFSYYDPDVKYNSKNGAEYK